MKRRQKLKPLLLTGWIVLGLMGLCSALEAEDFTYVTNKGAITITGYTGGDDVVIPPAINGLPVTSIGDWLSILASL